MRKRKRGRGRKKIYSYDPQSRTTKIQLIKIALDCRIGRITESTLLKEYNKQFCQNTTPHYW